MSNREPVCVIPPGCSTKQVGDLMTLLGDVCLGHELFMSNQTDGSIVIFYDRELETARKQRANTNIVEESEPNVEFEIGFQEDGEQKKFSYASMEPDGAIFGLASFMIPVLEEWDAANYVTTTIMHGDVKYALTVQRGEALTPAEKIATLEAEIAELTK